MSQPKSKIPLTPDDFEIEQTLPGAIIHIFPHLGARDTLMEIIKGLYILDYNTRTLEKYDKFTQMELPNYIKMANAENKFYTNKGLMEAEAFAKKFIDKVKSQ